MCVYVRLYIGREINLGSCVVLFVIFFGFCLCCLDFLRRPIRKPSTLGFRDLGFKSRTLGLPIGKPMNSKQQKQKAYPKRNSKKPKAKRIPHIYIYTQGICIYTCLYTYIYTHMHMPFTESLLDR